VAEHGAADTANDQGGGAIVPSAVVAIVPSPDRRDRFCPKRTEPSSRSLRRAVDPQLPTSNSQTPKELVLRDSSALGVGSWSLVLIPGTTLTAWRSRN
jgi:hypothetical protein